MTSLKTSALITRGSETDRNDVIDFIKGSMIVGMIVFHAVNYFASQFSPALLYVRFVSGGFAFITGYLVIAYYARKWATDPRRVAIRLWLRGFKLVVLFTLINLAISALSIRNFNAVEFGLNQFWERAADIYVYGGGRFAAFEILLPIGYLLLLSPIVLWFQKWPTVLYCALILAFAATLFLRMRLDNFAFVLVGAVGMLVGLLLPPDHISLRGHWQFSVPCLLLAVVALPWLSYSLAGYIAYIVIVFKCVADLSLFLPVQSVIRRLSVTCGKYVLFCYLSHILILQAIFRLVWPSRESSLIVLASIVGMTGLLMLLSVFAMDAARRRFQIVDHAYRFVFA